MKLKHHAATRWLHWIHFPLLTLMIWSGLLIYWANDVYRIGWGSSTLFKFFPDDFYRWFGIKYRLATGISWHLFLQWFFVFTGIVYVAYTLGAKQWYSRKAYNPIQRIAYAIILFMGALSALTGYAIYKPVQLHWLTQLFGGYEMARWIHFWLTLGYVGFFVVHVIQVIRAGWNNFRGMVSGYGS